MIEININDIANKVRSAVLTGLNTALTGAITAADTVLEAFGKIQNRLDQLPTNLVFYSTTAASDIPGYNKLVISLDDPNYDTIPVDVSTGSISGQGIPVGVLVSDAGIFAGNPGIINITTVGEIKRVSGTGTAEFYYEVYLRDSLGIETLLATSNLTAPVTTSVYQGFSAVALLNNGTWTATDRVVIKYFANRIAGGSNPVYNFLFGGTNPVRTSFPIGASLLLNLPIQIATTEVLNGTNGKYLYVNNNKVDETLLPAYIQLAASDESTALTTGTSKISFRMPHGMQLTGVRASLVTAQASGNIFTVDINENGNSILSTKLTIDNTELTSVTAATQPVISDTTLADDALITVDIDQIGNGTAKGLKITLIGFIL